jgi:hypothetical protein
LFWALLAAGQITMRKVDGWQTLNQKLAAKPIDLPDPVSSSCRRPRHQIPTHFATAPPGRPDHRGARAFRGRIAKDGRAGGRFHRCGPRLLGPRPNIPPIPTRTASSVSALAERYLGLIQLRVESADVVKRQDPGLQEAAQLREMRPTCRSSRKTRIVREIGAPHAPQI